MQHESGGEDGGLSRRSADIVVALILLGVGALVMKDSIRLGFGWGADGPQSGYFPFYVGLLIVISSVGTIAVNLVNWRKRRVVFVRAAQLRDVFKVLIPTVVFVGLIGVLGMYVATALFIAGFMRWLGKFGPSTIVLVALLVPFALFLLFEIWFLVPLPKGPLEDYFGY
jgi:putative tricarboxylic transport membrane protein